MQIAARNTTPLYGGFMRARSRSGWRRVERVGGASNEVSDGAKTHSYAVCGRLRSGM